MKNMSALLFCLLSVTVSVLGMQKDSGKKPAAVAARHVMSLDESKSVSSSIKCGPACTCTACLTNATIQLDSIISKLPILEFALKTKQLEGDQAIKTALMVHRAHELAKEIKRRKLLIKKVKSIPAAQNRQSQVNHETGRPRPVTPEELDNEFAMLADPTQESAWWVLEDAGLNL